MKKYLFDIITLIVVIMVTVVNLHKKSINNTLNQMNDVAMGSVGESMVAKHLAYKMTETEFERSALIQDYALNSDIIVTDENFSLCYNELTQLQRNYLDSIEYQTCVTDSLHDKYNDLVIEFNGKRKIIDYIFH